MIPELVGVEVDTLKQEYYLRAIMISKWNKETVWGSVKNHLLTEYKDILVVRFLRKKPHKCGYRNCFPLHLM